MAIWNYRTETTPNGQRRIASLRSALPFSLGKSGLQTIELVFVDDPLTRYDCLLQLSGGDFRRTTARAPRAEWGVDGRTPVDVLGSFPEGPPPRLSLRDPRHRWFELKGATRLTVSFRGNDYKRHRALFDVSGLDRGFLDWDGQRYAELYWERLGSETA